MKELQYKIEYIKGKRNEVADSLSRPVLVIQPSAEEAWLEKSREEIRTLQEEEERWQDLITYLEGGKVPNRKYKRTTLDQFTLGTESYITPSLRRMVAFIFA